MPAAITISQKRTAFRDRQRRTRTARSQTNGQRGARGEEVGDAALIDAGLIRRRRGTFMLSSLVAA
jgi:hypothetical protein